MRGKPIGDLVPIHEENVLRHDRVMYYEHEMGDYEGQVMVDDILDADDDPDAMKYMLFDE